MVSRNFSAAEAGLPTHYEQPTLSLVDPSGTIAYLSRQLGIHGESLKHGEFIPVTPGQRNPFLLDNLGTGRKVSRTWKAPIIYTYEDAMLW